MARPKGTVRGRSHQRCCRNTSAPQPHCPSLKTRGAPRPSMELGEECGRWHAGSNAQHGSQNLIETGKSHLSGQPQRVPHQRLQTGGFLKPQKSRNPPAAPSCAARLQGAPAEGCDSGCPRWRWRCELRPLCASLVPVPGPEAPNLDGTRGACLSPYDHEGAPPEASGRGHGGKLIQADAQASPNGLPLGLCPCGSTR